VLGLDKFHCNIKMLIFVAVGWYALSFACYCYLFSGALGLHDFLIKSYSFA